MSYEEVCNVIYPSLHVAWAFTYKRLGKDMPEYEDYAEVIDKLNKFGMIKDIEFEKDSKGKIHIHGIILLTKGFLRKRLITKGFSMRLDEIYDEKGWIRYIHKAQNDVKSPRDNSVYMF